MPQPKDWLDKLFTRTTPNDKELQAHYGWQQRDTAYKWYGNGMLKSVRTPEGATIRFEYVMPWAGVPLKRCTPHAIAMPGTATCCCMSGAMTGGEAKNGERDTQDDECESLLSCPTIRPKDGLSL